MHSLPTALYTNIRRLQCLIHVGTEGTPERHRSEIVKVLPDDADPVNDRLGPEL